MEVGSILITGASRGIGRALALCFHEAGWRVFAAMRNPGAWAFEGKDIRILSLDVTNADSVRRAAGEVSLDSLDVLVNNAAVFPGEGSEPFESTPPGWFEEAFACNVTGVVRVTQAFLPALRRAFRPRIVNISSGAGSISEKDDFSYYPYSVSKAALNMLTRAMACEYKDRIIVTAISPGWVRTDMGGANAPLSPEESAASLFKIIGGLSFHQSGSFIGRDGEPYAW